MIEVNKGDVIQGRIDEVHERIFNPTQELRTEWNKFKAVGVEVVGPGRTEKDGKLVDTLTTSKRIDDFLFHLEANRGFQLKRIG